MINRLVRNNTKIMAYVRFLLKKKYFIWDSLRRKAK